MKNNYYLLIALIIALATTGTYLIQNQNVTYIGAPWLMSYATQKTPLVGFVWGWPINGSLLLIDYRTSQKFIGGTDYQLIQKRLWDNMPTHPFSISDPSAMVIYATDSTDYSQQYFLVINQTKMPFLGGLNQTSNYGINPDLIAHTTMAYANTIPTSQYWLQEY